MPDLRMAKLDNPPALYPTTFRSVYSGAWNDHFGPNPGPALRTTTLRGPIQNR